MKATLVEGFVVNEWMSVRVSFGIVRGTGWIRPIVMKADWPLGRLSIDAAGVTISAGLLFYPISVDIPWETVTGVRQSLLGMELEYMSDGEQHELSISALFIWSRFTECLQLHNLQIPFHSRDAIVSN